MVPFIIKDEAVEQIRTIYDRMEKKKPNASVRLIITILSIAYGPEWAFTLDEYSPEIDECCDFDGLRVIIERSLLEATGGLTIEYEADKDDPESGIWIPSSYRNNNICTGAYGSMMPTFGFPGATDLQRPILSADFFRFSSNRIGFWCPSRISSCTSFTRHSCFTASTSRAITANGFAGRFFNVRSLCTASSFVASQQRWNPPIPLIATIPPDAIVFRVRPLF